jgi:hypothetical protein
MSAIILGPSMIRTRFDQKSLKKLTNPTFLLDSTKPHMRDKHVRRFSTVQQKHWVGYEFKSMRHIYNVLRIPKSSNKWVMGVQISLSHLAFCTLHDRHFQQLTNVTFQSLGTVLGKASAAAAAAASSKRLFPQPPPPPPPPSHLLQLPLF